MGQNEPSEPCDLAEGCSGSKLLVSIAGERTTRKLKVQNGNSGLGSLALVARVFWVLIGPERKTNHPEATSAQRDKKQEQ